MIVAGSGHRARTLGTDFPPLQLRLVDFAGAVLDGLKDVDLVVSGMALGWDQALARAATRAGIPFIAVIPFVGQELRWHSTDRAAYRDLLDAAVDVRIADPDPTNWKTAFQTRNERMVDLADAVLALWDGRKWGGTFNCLRYAHEQNVRVIQLYQAWQDVRGW